MAEKVKQAKPVVPPQPKKKMLKGTGVSLLVGLASFILGLYLLLKNFDIYLWRFELPSLTTAIVLLLAGLLLLKETAQRSTMMRIKNVYERYI